MIIMKGFGDVLAVLVTVTLGITPCLSQTDPVLTVSNYVVTLYEDETAIITLDTVTCTDADSPTIGPVASITFTPTTNCASCLRLYPHASNANEWELKFYPSVATLDYTTIATYFITMTCSDSTDTDQIANLEVRLTPNSYPTFDDGLAVAQTLTSPKTAYPAGTAIRTASATDVDSDSIFWSMTSSPSTTNIVIGLTTGIISAANDLITECNGEITLTVTITDNKLANPDTQIIVLTLSGANTAPTISNLDATGTWAEDTAAGSDLLTMTVVDDDTSQVTLTFTTLPTSAASLYTISAFKLQLASTATFDFEDSTLQSSQVMVVADDGNCASSTYTYTVSVSNVNEAPVITPTTQTFEVYEGAISVDPAWATTDEDSSHTTQTFTYSVLALDPTTAPLVISSSTGIISTSSDYDVDGGAMTATVTVTVQVADQDGLVSDTTVVISIKDTNDNAPVIDTASQNVAITGTTCALVVGSQATLTATDADSAYQDNNVFKFVLSSGYSSSYLSISDAGDVYLVSVPTVAYTETLQVDAVDAGQYPGNLTSIISSTIILTVTACVTTTAAAAATTAATYNDFSVDENVWWMVLAGIAAIGFILLTAWLCLTKVFPFCRHPPPGHWRLPRLSCSNKNKPKKIIPKPEKKKMTFKDAINKAKPADSNKPKPGNDGFWKVVQKVMTKSKGPPVPDAPVVVPPTRNAPSPKQAPPLADPLGTSAWQPQGNGYTLNNNYTDDFF